MTFSLEARTSSENVTSRFCNHFSIIQSHYVWKMCSNCPGIKLDQRLGHKKTKLNICHHILTWSRQRQNRSFHVVERTRTSSKCQKMKNARAKRAKILFFIVKYANLAGFCCRRRRGCLSSLKSQFSRTKHSNTCKWPINLFPSPVSQCSLHPFCFGADISSPMLLDAPGTLTIN